MRRIAPGALKGLQKQIDANMPKRPRGRGFGKRRRASVKRRRIARTKVGIKRKLKRTSRKKSARAQRLYESRLIRGINPYFPEFLRQTLVYKNNYRGIVHRDSQVDPLSLEDTYVAHHSFCNVPMHEAYSFRDATAVAHHPTLITPQGTCRSNMQRETQFESNGNGYGLPKHLLSLMRHYMSGCAMGGQINVDLTLYTQKASVSEVIAGVITHELAMEPPRVHIFYGCTSIDKWNMHGIKKVLAPVAGWPSVTQATIENLICSGFGKHKVVQFTDDKQTKKLKLKWNWNGRKLNGPHRYNETIDYLKYPHNGYNAAVRVNGFTCPDFIGDLPAAIDSANASFNSMSNALPVIAFLYVIYDQRHAINSAQPVVVNAQWTQTDTYLFGNKRQQAGYVLGDRWSGEVE